MKYLIFLLLIAGAEPDKPEVGIEPAARQAQVENPAGPPTQEPPRMNPPAARPATPQQTATPPENVPCPHCSRAEQLVVDLIYYKQILAILGEIDQQREQIDDGLLRSAHAELAKARPDLAALLKTEKAPAARPAPPVKKPEKSPKKPVKPAQKPKPRQKGIEGLVVGHVNEANRELGIKASVVLVSHGRPRSLTVGSVIDHNRRKFKIVKVDYVKDRGKGNRHEVHLEDQTNKQLYVVPWQ
ncbi:MAG: hypothetical protein OXI88_00410 [Gammaproteobacteria bacterium]|nr:hypothetical protein [Gammaproteobacteria bacterium]